MTVNEERLVPAIYVTEDYRTQKYYYDTLDKRDEAWSNILTKYTKENELGKLSKFILDEEDGVLTVEYKSEPAFGSFVDDESITFKQVNAYLHFNYMKI